MSVSAESAWSMLDDARARHEERWGEAVNEYRAAFGSVLDEELERAARTFASDGPLRAVLEPLAERLHDYLRWLRWSGWLSTQLPPPLGLTSAAALRRHAIAVVTYLGARLVDDGIDGHLHYKNKRDTLVADILALFPHCDEAAARCHSALAGFWILNHGQRRMRQVGEERAADAIQRLFSRIPQGVLAESAASALTFDTYEAIVQHKAVAYDMLLWQCVLAPVDESLRVPLLRALATTSRVAQHLNDVADAADDARRGQPNLVLQSFARGEDVRETSLACIAAALASLRPLGLPLHDAVGMIMYEVFDSARRLWREETLA